MGKYSIQTNKPSAPKRNTVNPVMRGIGCLLMVIVPIFAFALGAMLAGQGIGRQVIPAEWYGNVIFPDWAHQLSGLSFIAAYLSSVRHLQATLVFTVAAIIVIGGVMSIVFGYMYQMLAPSQYGPTDVPPPRVKTKKYKR